MANAKLSGSLLLRRPALPAAAPARRMTAPSGGAIDKTPGDRCEIHAGGVGDPILAQQTAMMERPVPASPTTKGQYRFKPMIDFGLLLCGIVAVAAAGSALFTHATERGNPAIAPRSSSVVSDPPGGNPTPIGLAAPPHSAAAPGVAAGAAISATVPPASSASPPPLAVANPAEPSAEAAPTISPVRETSSGTIAAVAGKSIVATDPGTAVASPAQPAPIDTAALAPTSPETLPTPAASFISSQPQLVVAGYAPAPATEPTAARLPAEEIAALIARGDALFGIGDIASARLCYERAAEGGSPQAALRLGETYDAAFLARAHLNGVRGDAAVAARWYRHARELGAVEADALLSGILVNDGAKAPEK